ncbi:MAG TPA: hypothetical protein VGK78_14710 [Nocardioides sp.]|uniref:hypothetical protein n=1 Tax=Nocardioides sp. TaxID=35761 RepID=UPI002F3E73DC
MSTITFEVVDLSAEPDGSGNPTSFTVTLGPEGSSSGAVSSVNGQTGAVVLDAGDVGAATTAQGAEADTAIQPGDLAAVATTGAYSDLTGTPSLGTAASHAATDFDTAGAAASAQTTAESYTDSAVAGLAPLASPAFTGNPTAPTPTAGDNDTSIATTAFVTNAVAKQPEALIYALGDESTAITTGTKVTARIPFAFAIAEIRASLTTASSSGNPTFDVKKNGTSVFSTLLSIDATEKTSKTATTAAVLSTTGLSDDDELTFSVSTAGTGAAGPKITIIGSRA